MEKKTTTTKLLSDLDKVLEFSSEMIVQSLNEEKPDDSIISDVRKSCEKLTESGVYAFNTNCSDQELFKQIQEFATHIDG